MMLLSKPEVFVMKSLADRAVEEMKAVGFSVDDPEMSDLISVQNKCNQLFLALWNGDGIERQNIH